MFGFRKRKAAAAAQAEVPRKGRLRIMDRIEGDRVVEWDVEVAPTVAECEEMFNAKRAEGYLGYSMDEKSGKGEMLLTFDPQAEEIVMSMPLVAG